MGKNSKMPRKQQHFGFLNSKQVFLISNKDSLPRCGFVIREYMCVFTAVKNP